VLWEGEGGSGVERRELYTRNYGIVAGEMGLACFAAKDLVGIEVGIVEEPHPHHLWAPWAGMTS